MSKVNEIKDQLDTINLEERIELVNVAATEVEDSGNGLCCCSDAVE